MRPTTPRWSGTRWSRTRWSGLALTGVLSLAACGGSGGSTSSSDAATATTAVTSATTAPASTATTPPTTPPAAPATTAATGQVSANEATRAELQAAFTAAGISSPAQWAREVEEYRPYPTDDPTFAKLRQELAKYNPGPGVVDQIVAALAL